MTTFIKAKFKKSENKMNIEKYRVAANIAEYQINLPENHYSKIHDIKKYAKISKNYIFKLNDLNAKYFYNCTYCFYMSGQRN